MVLVVLFVCQNGPDIDSLSIKVHYDYQAEFVPANVEHNEISDFVRRGEGGTQGLKARTVMSLHDFEPSSKGTFAVGVLFPKLA